LQSIEDSQIHGPGAGGLKILASSKNIDAAQLALALKHNPAGNAAEQTPIVLIRGIPVA
jgi:hypothetical protein